MEQSLGRFGDRRLEKGDLPAQASGRGRPGRRTGPPAGRQPGRRGAARALPAQPARDATRDGRHRQRPKRNRPAEAAKLPGEVELSFVEAYEVNAPPGVEPVHWRLLTTHAVTSLAEARQITRFYRARWTIEQLFRVMKTKGFDIEAVRIIEAAPFEKLTAATLIAAIQVLQLTRERDGAGGPAPRD